MWWTGLERDWPVRLCSTYTVWESPDPTRPCFSKSVVNNVTVTTPCLRLQRSSYAGRVSPIDLIISFHLLTAGFQLFPVALWLWRGCPSGNDERRLTCIQTLVMRGINPVRFIEYAITSTIMVIIIALLVGITDLWIVILLATANWSVMIFGLVHEFLVSMWRYNR